LVNKDARALLRKIGTACVMAFISACVLVSPALAHLDLVATNPVEGQILDSVPKLVQLWFNEDLDPFESAIVVRDANGAQVDLGNFELAQGDRTEMRVGLPDDLAAGTYSVQWNAVHDADGHPITGEFSFRIKSASPGSQTETATFPVVLIVLAVGILPVGVVAVVIRNVRKRGS